MNYDKIKVKTSNSYIYGINEEQFNAKIQNGVLISQTYNQKLPFDLTIMNNIAKNELIIEFTSKVLLNNCHLLINAETIRECFENIVNLNICKLYIDNLLNDSQVIALDITKDINFDVNNHLDHLLTDIRQSIVNYNRWNCNKYPANRNAHGIAIQNIVTSRKYSKRLTIYDKYADMCKASNRTFLSRLGNAEEVKERFRNKLRFELNAKTMAQVRNYLNIRNNNLMTVLEANTTNPIYEFINEVIRDAETCAQSDITVMQLCRLALLEQCKWDLKEVEMRIRTAISKNQSIGRAMKPFKQLHSQHNPVNVKKCLLEMVA